MRDIAGDFAVPLWTKIVVSAMPPNLLRLAYVFEFLLALLAILSLWSEVGGQGHLDLMPWYTKLGLIAGLALAIVMGTASAVSHERAWNARTLACAVAALLIAGGMAAATYYYHLHENDEDSASDSSDGLAVLAVCRRSLA